MTAIDENNNQLEDVKVEAIGKEVSYEAHTMYQEVLPDLTMNYDNYSIAFTKEKGGYESNLHELQTLKHLQSSLNCQKLRRRFTR